MRNLVNPKRKLCLPSLFILPTTTVLILHIIHFVILKKQGVLDIVNVTSYKSLPSTERIGSNEFDIRSYQSQSIGLKCLSFAQHQIDQILEKTEQIFIGMPDKAAGTSFAKFTKNYCMKNYNFPPDTMNNLNKKKTLKYIAMNNGQFPPVVSSHIENEQALIRLLKDSTDETAIVYIHRQETERLLSGIKEVAENLCSGKGAQIYPILAPFEKTIDHSGPNGYNCVFPEKTIFDIIDTKVAEIGKGAVKAVQCDFYKAIESHKPRNMIIMNYKQVDRLQEAIARRYCPDVVDQLPIRSKNVGIRHKGMTLDVRLDIDQSKVVPLNEWLIQKKHVLEILYDWYDEYDCHGKLRNIEETLFDRCDDEILQMVAKNDFFVVDT